MGFELNHQNCCAINLSINNPKLTEAKLNADFNLHDFVFGILSAENKKAGIGGYLEKRNIYEMSAVFKNDEQYFRNIHLGIDIWCAEGSPVFAPFDGTLHSFNNNYHFGDYGPTLITQHTLQNQTFYLLFGHLSVSTLAGLHEGMPIHKGQQIATLGGAHENVGWPPHLHFQIIVDLQQKKGDYFGVCHAEDLPFFTENCPNPNLILNCNLNL